VKPIRLHRRCLRHFVWAALFAWVFALAASVANACIVSAPTSAPPGHENHRHPQESSHQDSVSIESADHDSAGHTDHEHAGGIAHDDAGKAGCLKFCSDGSSALSKNGSLGFDQVPAHAVDGFKIQPVAITADARLSLERPSAQGPPLVIRLLRLTL
jgi:hypothetical protein